MVAATLVALAMPTSHEECKLPRQTTALPQRAGRPEFWLSQDCLVSAIPGKPCISGTPAEGALLPFL